MTAGQQLERSVLESKERDELHAIAQAMSLKTTSRTKKADIIDQILEATGVSGPAPASNGSVEPNGEAPAPRGRRPAAKVVAETETTDDGADEDESAGSTVEVAESQESTNGSGHGNSSGTITEPRTQSGDRNQAGQGTRQGSQNRQHNNGQGANGEAGNRRSRRRRSRDRAPGGERELQGGSNQESYQGELVEVRGLLDLRDEGYGFLRCDGYLPSGKDVYVSISQARRFALRKGDYIEGACRPASNNEKYPALLRIDTVSLMDPEEARNRPRFEDLTPLFPDSRLVLEEPGDKDNLTARIVDLLAPIGKGQRGMIVSPPKAGKTTVMKQIAHSIEANNPDVHLMVLLVDERPEEVTDMRRSVKGEVVASTFDRPSDEHTAVAELAIERAKRLVEVGRHCHHSRRHHPAGPCLQPGRTGDGADHVRWCGLRSPVPAQEVLRRRPQHRRGWLDSPSSPPPWSRRGQRWTRSSSRSSRAPATWSYASIVSLAERRLYPSIDVNASYDPARRAALRPGGQLQQVWKLTPGAECPRPAKATPPPAWSC